MLFAVQPVVKARYVYEHIGGHVNQQQLTADALHSGRDLAGISFPVPPFIFCDSHKYQKLSAYCRLGLNAISATVAC